MSKSKKPELKPGEGKYVATVKLRLNYGRLEVRGGDVIILGDEDRAQGIHIENLLKNKGIVPYESDEQVKEIKRQYQEEVEPRRQELRQGALRKKRGER
ncbi:hypothetical protein CMI37_13900 [Candidatus Pacearchaeota archaeon]|nr:hypothetical protein [Candidatus Pacearchaeota archaeon]|tara:strand:- start:530 stop:826 length:297 start_codon:yes stop_codon:yes gene_type:complete